MKFNVISSGSKGNITYVEHASTKILIDAGISLKEIKARTNINLQEIDAILVTHEHSDHVSNLINIAKETKANIYIDENSFVAFLNGNGNREKAKDLNFFFISANKKYQIKDIMVYTLLLNHDTASCLGFIFNSGEDSLAYITDTGFVPVPYISILQKVNALIIEANHDIELLNNSKRPYFLKERIFSVNGHMSNVICGQIVNNVLKSKKLKILVLAHLSEECNTEELAVDTVMSKIEGEYLPEIIVAKQYKATGIIDISDANKINMCG